MAIPKPAWAKQEAPMPPWGEPSYPHPMVPDFDTGDGSYGANDSALSPHNNDRGSRIPDRAPQKTAFHRGQTECNGARLSISPSAKIPQNDPASGMNRVQASRSRTQGRSAANFSQGR